MIGRVKDFCLANPTDDAGYTALVTRLTALDAEGNARLQEQDAGNVQESGNRELRDTLGSEILAELRHLVNVAKLAAAAHPELAIDFRMPRERIPHVQFIATARRMVASATSSKEVMEQFGLGGGFVEALTPMIEQFEAATKAAHDARAMHVGAVAQLPLIAREASAIVGVLNGFIRRRFKGDGARLAAWKSARNVAGPFTSQPDAPPPSPAPVADGRKAA